jgi:hypothetical protein
MIPAEQRKKLEEMHRNWATQSFDGYASSAFMAGAESAWELREAEISRVKYEINQYLEAYAPDFFNEPECFKPKLDMNSAALVRRTLKLILKEIG